MSADSEIETLRQRLADLTAEALRNEQIMRRTQEREFALLRVDGLTPLLHALVDGLREAYQLDATSLVILDPQHEIRHLLLAAGDRPDELRQVNFVDSLVGLAPQFAALTRPWLGPFVGADHQLLLPGRSDLRSVALLPMPRKERASGVICFGSRDPNRFTRQHGSEFLEHLGAIAAVCLDNAINQARLLRAGITDYLTGWHNRRYLQQRLKEELARAHRHHGKVACLMLDLDKLKSINDEFGHLAGDNALKEVAHRVETEIRGMDTAARFGGDEFAIILPDAGVGEATHLAERIRIAVSASPLALLSNVSRNVSVSVGVASIAPGRDETEFKSLSDRLVAEADAALYRAKAMGRNRVQVGGLA